MPKSGQPLFLARRSYRRRRMMDAARLLPVAGAVILLLPIAWEPATSPAPDTARGMIYLFGSWGMLILGALILARGLAPSYDEEEAAEGSAGLGGAQQAPPALPPEE